MEKGIIEQLDVLNSQKVIIGEQSKVVANEMLALNQHVQKFKDMKRELLKDVEKKVWETVGFFIKVWKIKF